MPPPPTPTLIPYTTLFRSRLINGQFREQFLPGAFTKTIKEQDVRSHHEHGGPYLARTANQSLRLLDSHSELAYELDLPDTRSEEHTSELQSQSNVVCRLLL